VRMKIFGWILIAVSYYSCNCLDKEDEGIPPGMCYYYF